MLEEDKAPQRYKTKYDAEDMTVVLEETYKHFVAIGRREYKQEYSLPNIRRVAKWISETNKDGLLLYGTIGSGKTTLMESLIKALTILAPEQTKKRKSAIEITNEAKNDTTKFEETKRVQMLFIDDLGEEATDVLNYGSQISPIIETLYYRYDKRLFTVITTNLLDNEIAPKYGVRIKDRFNEMFDRVYFDIESFRKS